MTDFAGDYRAGEQAGQRFVLVPPRQAPLGTNGATLSSRVGSSMEFRDFREYQPGDDLRHLDWNAYARSDQLILRVYREEVLPHLEVIADTTKSMDLPDSQKANALRACAAFFATVAINSGFSTQGWVTSPQCHPIAPTNTLPGIWPNMQLQGIGSPAESISQHAHRFRPRSIRVFISDLLWLGDPRSLLHPIANQAAQLLVIHLLADADAHPPAGGSLRLWDVETEQEREIYLDASVLKRYRANLDRHQSIWEQSCRQLGAIYVPVIAEELLQSWDWRPLIERQVLEVV